MLLTIDVGNTNLAIGLFEGSYLVSDWRLATDRYRTADEWGQLLRSLLHMDNREYDLIHNIIISCVVPPLESTLNRTCQRYFQIEPLFVTHQTDLGIAIAYDNPAEVGADRLVNAVGAIDKYKTPSVIIDFGTATTFDVIDSKNRYCGGAICPGIGISANALFEKAAKLPRIDIVKPPSIIGKNTINSMQSGLYYGYLEQIKGIVSRIEEEMNQHMEVIITGGLARVFQKDLGHNVIYDPTLTLYGLRLIFDRNQKRK